MAAVSGQNFPSPAVGVTKELQNPETWLLQSPPDHLRVWTAQYQIQRPQLRLLLSYYM